MKRILIAVLVVAGIWGAHYEYSNYRYNHRYDNRPKLSAAEAGAATCGVDVSQVTVAEEAFTSPPALAGAITVYAPGGRSVIVHHSELGGFIEGDPTSCQTNCQLWGDTVSRLSASDRYNLNLTNC
jgi:hypothetical protein